MSLYQKASLVQIPSGYKAADAKLYSVVPNSSDGDFTVSSDADATRVNKDGLIETTVANQARLNYDPTNPQDPHLLLEPTRTQLAGYSKAITSANGYVLTNGTLTANDSTAPDGSLTASTFKATSANGQFQKVKGGSSGVEYSVSVYVKRKTGTGTVYLRAVENTNTAVTVTDEWKRVSATVTSTSTNVRFGMALGTSGDEIYVWGFQVEAGSYPTSFIPNADNSEITRTVDSNEISSGLENIIGQTEGTIFLDFEYLYETTSDSSTDALRDIFVLGTASDISEGISIDNFRSQFRVFVQGSGMTTQSIGSSSTGSAQPNTRYKLAVKYKTGDCKAYLNGSLLGSSTGTVSFAADLDGIFFSYNSSSRPFKNQKKVYQLMVFNEALTDAELITLTT